MNVCPRRPAPQLDHEGPFFEPVDRGDVRMVERGQRLGFALEAQQAIGIARERLRQSLQCDVTIELRIAGAIALAHPTFVKERSDCIDAEAAAGRKCQGLEYTAPLALERRTLRVIRSSP